MTDRFPTYDWKRTYEWNYEHVPAPVDLEVPSVSGDWDFCGLPVDSPLGIPAGPLLNGGWCLYYASLGFDVLTYKTVRSRPRECYGMPNLQPVDCGPLSAPGTRVPSQSTMTGSWAVSFGMPSKGPEIWRADVERTRQRLPAGKLLSVSVVASVEPGWSIDQLADDYAICARWAIESGADAVETNFSCPNVSTCDGQLYQVPQDARTVAERVREAVGEAPYLVKVGHVGSDEAAEELIEALEGSVDGLAMTNSISATVSDENQALFFDGEPRGICGAAILDASVEQVARFSRLMAGRSRPLTIVGVGGARTGEDVEKYHRAGASAVHVATEAMTRPECGVEIREKIARLALTS